MAECHHDDHNHHYHYRYHHYHHHHKHSDNRDITSLHSFLVTGVQTSFGTSWVIVRHTFVLIWLTTMIMTMMMVMVNDVWFDPERIPYLRLDNHKPVTLSYKRYHGRPGWKRSKTKCLKMPTFLLAAWHSCLVISLHSCLLISLQSFSLWGTLARILQPTNIIKIIK